MESVNLAPGMQLVHTAPKSVHVEHPSMQAAIDQYTFALTLALIVLQVEAWLACN